MAFMTKYSGVVLVLLGMTGCENHLYAWHGYDDALYRHYKVPAQYEQFVIALKEVVDEGDASGRIPPGIYAEYGYALYEQGKLIESIAYFKKESDKWPESRFLMTKMIAMSQKRTLKPDEKATPADTKGTANPEEAKQ
jgi:hypothetical protein